MTLMSMTLDDLLKTS